MSTRATLISKGPNTLPSMKNILLSLQKRPLIISSFFLCKSHYIDSLLKKFGIDNSLGNFACTQPTPKKDEILDNRVCFVFLWNFNQKWRIGSSIIRLDSEITGVLTNSVILLCLPNAPRNLFPKYSTRGIMWRIKSLSCNSIKTFDLSTLYTTIPPLKTKRKI